MWNRDRKHPRQAVNELLQVYETQRFLEQFDYTIEVIRSKEIPWDLKAENKERTRYIQVRRGRCPSRKELQKLHSTIYPSEATGEVWTIYSPDRPWYIISMNGRAPFSEKCIEEYAI